MMETDDEEEWESLSNDERKKGRRRRRRRKVKGIHASIYVQNQGFCLFTIISIIILVILIGLNIGVFFFDGKIDNIEIFSNEFPNLNVTLPWIIFIGKNQWPFPHLFLPAQLLFLFISILLTRRLGPPIILIHSDPKKKKKKKQEEEEEEEEEEMTETTTTTQWVGIPDLVIPWPMVLYVGFWSYFFVFLFNVGCEVAWELIENFISDLFQMLLINGSKPFWYFTYNYWNEIAADLLADIVQSIIGSILAILVIRFTMPFTPASFLWDLKSVFLKFLTIIFIIIPGIISFFGVFIKRTTFFGLLKQPLRINVGFYLWLWIELIFIFIQWSIDIFWVPSKNIPRNYPNIRDRHWFYVYIVFLALFAHFGALDLRFSSYITSWITTALYFVFTFLLKWLYKIQTKSIEYTLKNVKNPSISDHVNMFFTFVNN